MYNARPFQTEYMPKTASICVTIYLLLLGSNFRKTKAKKTAQEEISQKTIYEIGEPVIQRETIGRRETLEKRGGCRPPNAKLLVGSGDNANLMPLFGEPFE
jgi:hypothetical protein